MSDKVQKIKEEIENQRNEYNKIWEITHSDDLESHIAYANKSLLDRLLQFIDSLQEEHNEDLEEAAQQYARAYTDCDNGNGGNDWEDDIAITFKAGAEWQRKKDQETIELAEDHAMLAGMSKMKEEMMKDAIESVSCTYSNKEGTFLHIKQGIDTKDGDKVKILIIKED